MKQILGSIREIGACEQQPLQEELQEGGLQQEAHASTY